MDKKEDNPNFFEMDLKILGTDLFSVRLSAGNVTNRWVFTVLVVSLVILGSVAVIGPDIKEFLQVSPKPPLPPL